MLSNSFGGLANFRFELICELLNRKEDVYLAFPFDKDIQEQDQENKAYFKKLGCHFVDTQMSRKGTSVLEDYKLFRCYKKIIFDIKPDVILTYTIKPNIYGSLAAGSKVPVLMSITGLGTAIENASFMSGLLTFLYKIAIKKCRLVFFQNKGNADYFSLHESKYRLVPGSGVNLEKYKLLPYPSEGTISFLFVARIMKEKGIEQFIDAARYIKSKYSNTEFHVVGACDDQNYKEHLYKCHMEGILEYHGQQRDVISFQKNNSCAVHPSYYPEGMSNVLLEAAACGRPIITTDRSGCREIIDNGVNGFICKTQDSQDLILQIEKFLALSWEERKNMGLAGRSKIEKEFDRNIVVSSYLEEIYKCV